MKFKTSIDSVIDIQIDLLTDILAIQTLMMERLAVLEANEKGADRNEILGGWKEEIKNKRQLIANELFAKHGPDPSEELGLGAR